MAGNIPAAYRTPDPAISPGRIFLGGRRSCHRASGHRSACSQSSAFYVSANELDICCEIAQYTPPGTKVPAMTLLSGGVTLSRPVELVGRTRMTSRMTALRKGILTRSLVEGTQSPSIFPGKVVFISSTSRCWSASSRAIKWKMFVIVLLVVSLPPTMKLMHSAIIFSSVSSFLACSFLPANRKLNKSSRDSERTLRCAKASVPILPKLEVARRPALAEASVDWNEISLMCLPVLTY